jgi:hypothetical protein
LLASLLWLNALAPSPLTLAVAESLAGQPRIDLPIPDGHDPHMISNQIPRALVIGLAGIIVPVLLVPLIGLTAGTDKPAYDLLRDLFVPLIGPLVAVLIPLLLFFVIPIGQNRERTAIALCQQYYDEEMRDSRNVGWRYFVTELRRATDDAKLARRDEFFGYLTNPEVHGTIEPALDAVFQKTTRVLDYFALVDECLARHAADPSIVRSFLLYYYLWWRDEIMEPLRNVKPLTTDNPKFRPGWWRPLKNLDALAGRANQPLRNPGSVPIAYPAPRQLPPTA